MEMTIKAVAQVVFTENETTRIFEANEGKVTVTYRQAFEGCTATGGPATFPIVNDGMYGTGVLRLSENRFTGELRYWGFGSQTVELTVTHVCPNRTSTYTVTFSIQWFSTPHEDIDSWFPVSEDGTLVTGSYVDNSLSVGPVSDVTTYEWSFRRQK